MSACLSTPVRRVLLSAALAGAGLMAAGVYEGAQAQDFPTRPITIIVPYTAGGPTDMMGRAIAKHMAVTGGQPVVVENRAGAGGAIGTAATARSAPDGYTLVLNGTLGHALAPLLRPNSAGYTVAEMSAIGVFSRSSNFLVVAPSLGVKSVKELIDRAKAEPGKISFSSAGLASNPHLGAELFKALAGVDLEHIPYKGVSASVPDLVAGRVPVAFASPTLALPLLKDNRLVALAVTGENRMKGWEQLPTVAESGVPGYVFESTYILVAPGKTSPALMTRLNQMLQRALEDPETVSALDKLGLETMKNTPAQADQLVQAELDRWSGIIKRLNLKLE
jgi:tripartite-type tricarboxylate transporter receptor subunit TctC